MNLLHLKYVIEISKTKSLNKAAENLFMAQPNLSRSLKELEDSLGFELFKRTPKGMVLTEIGEEFVKNAEVVVKQFDEMEANFSAKSSKAQQFSLSLPRASYVCTAFTNFLNKIDKSKDIDFNYKETNAMRVIKNVEQDGFRLGILRYGAQHEEYFRTVLIEKGLNSREIFEFSYVLLMSKDSPLAKKDKIYMEDLTENIEILHGDPYVPTLSTKEVKKAEFSGITNKNIFIYERSSQFEILNNVKETYMWISPLTQEVLERHNLVQKKCCDYVKTYKDVLIYKKNYSFSELDDMFLSELKLSLSEVKRALNAMDEI